MRRGVVLIGAITVLAVVANVPALAVGWVPTPATVVVDSDKSKQALDIATSSNGDAVAVWSESTEAGTAVKASVRLEGTWSAPALIEDGGGYASVYPQAVIDQNGFATVMWSRNVPDPADKSISFATRPLGGSWSSPAEIVPDQQGESLEVAISPDGSVSAAWQHPTGGAIVADKAAGGTTWNITELGGQGGPVLAAAADNRMAVAWNPGGNSEQLSVKVRAAGGTWADAPLEAGSTADPATEWLDIPHEPAIAFGADGALHVTYWEYEDPTVGNPLERVRYSTRSSGGTWAYHPEPLSAPDTITQTAALAGDSNGNVTVVWTAVTFDLPDVYYRYWAATRVEGTWEAPYPLTGPDPANGLSTPELLIDGDDLFTAVWGQEFAAKSNRRTASGAWLAQPESIAPSTVMNLQAALEADGDPLAAWTRTFYVNGNQFHSVVESRIYDSSAPPTDVTGPVTTMTGPAKAFYLTTTVPVAWSAVDAESVVAASRLRYRAASWNGDYPSQYENLTTFFSGSELLYTPQPGKTYCFQAQARDSLDNEGGWSPDLCTATPVDDRTATRKGVWRPLGATRFYRSTALKTTDRGATLTLAGVQGQRVGLVVTKCKGCGKVTVRFGKQLLGTWSLNARKTRDQVYLPVKLFDTVRTGRLVVKVVSAEGRKVILDGVLVGRR